MKFIRPLALTTIAFALVLTGCSAPAQTKAEACEIIATDLAAVEKDIQKKYEDRELPPLDQMYSETLASMQDTAKKVTHEDVSDAYDARIAAMVEMEKPYIQWIQDTEEKFAEPEADLVRLEKELTITGTKLDALCTAAE